MSSEDGTLRRSATFPPETVHEIQRAADEGVYEIRGYGAKRKVPSFDDLLLLGASMSRYPLEGYRERCDTNVVLGTRFAKKPLELKIPITIAGMSFGALGANAKEALGRAATAMGTSTTTGDGGMTDEERKASKLLVYQVLPSRYGLNPDDLRRADAIEVVVGQGAKPGGGGMLLGPEDHAARGRDARPARGHRPAQRLPPPRLDRAGRSRDQAARAARDHRLAEADLRQGRRDADLLRRHPGGEVRRGRRRGRRHAGRHGRDPGRVHRACRHPHPARDAPGGAGAAGPGHAPQGAADRLGRHPERRRRRQGAGPGRGRGLDRRGLDDRPGLQQGRSIPRTMRRLGTGPATATTAIPAAARSASPPRTRSSRRGCRRRPGRGWSRTT